jgi:serine/threonine protein kinase
MMLQGPGVRLQDGRYALQERIGKGGFSSVYKARDALLQETIAIKMLEPTVAEDRLDSERVLVEVKATMVHLRHPRIVGTFNLFQEGGRFFIAMEYMVGGSLEQRIYPSRCLVLDDAIRVMTDICEGLSYAHDSGIVHCDMKPANILFDHQDRAKVADFGIADISQMRGPELEDGRAKQYNIASIRNLLIEAFMAKEITRFCQDRPVFRPILVHFGPNYSLADMTDALIEYCRTRILFDELLTEIREFNPKQYDRHSGELCWNKMSRTGTVEPRSTSQDTSFVVGTLPYMAPEQLEGVRDDPCVDVYALGAILYRMLMGRFYLDFDMQDTSEARMQNMWLIKSQPPGLMPGLPPSLERVILRSLAKDPRQRYRTAGEMRTALLKDPSPALAQQRERLDRERQVRNYIDWGTSALNDGDYSEAIAHFGRGLELDPNNEKLRRFLVVAGHQRDRGRYSVSPDVRRMVRAYISMGESALRAQALDDAIQYFEEALKLEPENEKARRYLTIALHRRGEEQGSTGPQPGTRQLRTWLQRGERALQSGRYDEAIQCFGEVLEIDPDHYRAADLLTQARIARKRPRR